MVTDIADRLVKPFTYLSQFETLKIKQLERLTLHCSEIVKRRKQEGEINPQADFPLDVTSPCYSIVQRVNICTRVKASSQ